MNQDTLSGVYDFPAREYEVQGRWPSPDPLGVGAVDPTDPQSWNRYAYVRNSPLTLRDPNGMDYCAWPNDPPDAAPAEGEVPEGYCEYNGGTWYLDEPGTDESGGGGDGNPVVPGITDTVSAGAPDTQTIEIDPSMGLADPGNSDQGGGGGGGVGSAMTAAEDALQSKLCGQAIDGGSGTALGALHGTDPYHEFTIAVFGEGDLGSKGVAALTYPESIAPSRIIFNTNAQLGFFTPFLIPGVNEPFAVRQAIVVLHELAHAAFDHWYASDILPDGGNDRQSDINSQTVDFACFAPYSDPTLNPVPVAAARRARHF